MNSMTPLKHLVPLCLHPDPGCLYSHSFPHFCDHFFFFFLLPDMCCSQVNLSHTDSAFYWCRDLHSLVIVTRQHTCVSLVNEKLIPDRWSQRQQTTIRAFFHHNRNPPASIFKYTEHGFIVVCGRQVLKIYVNTEQSVAFNCQIKDHSVFYGMGATHVYSQFQEAKYSPPNLRFLI